MAPSKPQVVISFLSESRFLYQLSKHIQIIEWLLSLNDDEKGADQQDEETDIQDKEIDQQDEESSQPQKHLMEPANLNEYA